MSADEKLAQLNAVLDQVLPDQKDRKVFQQYYEQYLKVPSIIDWSQMTLFDKEKYQEDYDSLPELDAIATAAILKRVVVIKLNGGLGTTMGCDGPKSLIKVKEGLTFLELAIRQNRALNCRYGSEVPLYLMDSYRTEATTRRWLVENHFADDVKQFTQSKCPRIFADSLLPVPEAVADRPEDGWYPPGHGNIFAALDHSGLLDELLGAGRDLIFVSNVDNTAATVDVKIASVIARENVDYVMENTDKTLQDVKGGTLIQYEGTIKHLELPHVPADRVSEFASLKTFKTFNTNNIWVDLKAVKRKLETMRLEVLPNKKKLRDGREVIQLESAIGGAIRNFARAKVVHVPRSRFRPVKKTQDLLVMMSNALVVEPDFALRVNPARASDSIPVVHLSAHYDGVADFFRHFDAIPDLLECSTLTVEGDVHFGAGVKCVGEVVVRGQGSIASGTVLSGVVQL